MIFCLPHEQFIGCASPYSFRHKVYSFLYSEQVVKMECFYRGCQAETITPNEVALKLMPFCSFVVHNCRWFNVVNVKVRSDQKKLLIKITLKEFKKTWLFENNCKKNNMGGLKLLNNTETSSHKASVHVCSIYRTLH